MSEEEPTGDQNFSFVDKRRRYEEEEVPAASPEPTAESTPAEAPSEADEAFTAEERAALDDAAHHYAHASKEAAQAPGVDFPTFVLSLASSAAAHLGGHQDPVSGHVSVNLDLARQTIDIITMLHEKTKGNLTADEDKLLSHVLYDLRMRFIEQSQGK